MLYLVKSYNAIKIGSTNNIKIRMHDYKTHNPDFELLDIADGGLEEEKKLQQKLEKLFTPIFEEHGLIWNKNTSMKLYFPDFIKKIRTINKVKYKFYTFNIF